MVSGKNARFLAWLRERNIRVVHLVRGATMLRSNDLSKEQGRAKSQHGKRKRALTSVHDLTTLSALQEVFKPQKYSRKQLASTVHQMEAGMLYWRRLLDESATDHHVLLYESLLGPSRDAYFEKAVTYLGGHRGAALFDSREAVANGTRANLRVHPSTCEERIKDWNEIKLVLPGDSLTLMSCELLASFARAESLL